MTRLALLLCACSGFSAHPPSLDGCPRSADQRYEAVAECLYLYSIDDTLFHCEGSASCSGPKELCLKPGAVAYAMERKRPAEPADWDGFEVDCGVCEAGGVESCG